MKKCIFDTTATACFIALSLLLSPLYYPAFAQNNTDPNNAQENLDRAGDNLEDAGQNLLEATEDATTELQVEIAETADEIEQNANWGWLGLIGLLGLFGLAGRGKQKVVHHYHETDPNVVRTPPTNYRP